MIDVTCIGAQEGLACPAVVIDLYSRRAAGRMMRNRPAADDQT